MTYVLRIILELIGLVLCGIGMAFAWVGAKFLGAATSLEIRRY